MPNSTKMSNVGRQFSQLPRKWPLRLVTYFYGMRLLSGKMIAAKFLKFVRNPNLLEWTYRYYSIVCCGPISLRKHQNRSVDSLTYFLRHFFYYLTRALGFVNVAYQLTFILGGFRRKLGPSDVFQLLEGTYWLMANIFYIAGDSLLTSEQFPTDINAGLKLFRKQDSLSVNFKCWRFILFSA